MRVSILGNSGSGKSTLARTLAELWKSEVLDLDTVAWESGKIAVPRELSLAYGDIDTFIGSSATNAWIVEGCYGNLVQHTLQHQPLLIFLDPGVDQSMKNGCQKFLSDGGTGCQVNHRAMRQAPPAAAAGLMVATKKLGDLRSRNMTASHTAVMTGAVA